MSCRTTNARRAAASSSCSRSAGWDWNSTRRSASRSPGRSCRWRPAARCTASRTSRTSSTATRPRPRTSCTRCTTAWRTRWSRCWRKAQRELRRVLLIGGVTRNAAMLAALREKLPGDGIRRAAGKPVVRGVGQRPAHAATSRCHQSPQIRAPAGPRQPAAAPALRRPRAGHRRAAAAGRRPTGPLVLGVDAGSTTTKAVLLDPATRGVVASHYARTQRRSRGGDPRVPAGAGRTRWATARSGWRATTGSARELVGAYLGTAHVYNEISAHAAGATHFDADVDTIFEIGGQDSKYILLRNGVPIDYAMNNACSAGTGSFLEESAQGDLGIGVADIAGHRAGRARPGAVQGDLRGVHQFRHPHRPAAGPLARQHRRRAGLRDRRQLPHPGQRPARRRPEGVPAGRRGPEPRGRPRLRAQRRPAGRDPAQPGIARRARASALLALQRGRRCAGRRATDLLPGRAGDEAGRPLHLPGLQDVLQHRPFRGGRPAIPVRRPLQPVRERVEAKARTAPRPTSWSSAPTALRCPKRLPPADRWHALRWASDRLRNAKTFLEDALGRQPPARSRRHRIGIPRALTTHSLYPALRDVLFAGLGWEVVLSGVDPRGDLKSYSGFCFPAQIAHGAVLDLARQRRGSGLPAARGAHAAAERLPRLATCARSRRRVPISWPRRFPTSASSRRCSISPTATTASPALVETGGPRAGSPPRTGRAGLGRGRAGPDGSRARAARAGAARARRRRWRRASRPSCSPATATTPSRRRPRSRWAGSSPAWASR